MYSGTKLVIGVIAICLFFIGSFTFGIAYHHNEAWAAIHYVSNVFSMIGIAASGLWLIINGENVGEGNYTERSWESTGIAGYSGNIPEFALARAISIKEAIPNCTLYIHYLQQSSRSYTKPRPLPDPFLVAYMDSEYVYIDVWDEKEYETKIL